MAQSTEHRITVGQPSSDVSAILVRPPDATSLYILAHGAGAGMRHPFLGRITEVLAGQRIATLRYQFPYMERKTRRPDPPAVATATVRAAVALAQRLAPELPMIAGGKSFGGRMTSTAQAAEPLLGVRGLAFLGFPLHPPGKPAVTRGEHLDAIRVPMLFLQGDRDEFAEPILLRQVLRKLGSRATLHLVNGGDHSFSVPKKSGRSPEDVFAELATTIAVWVTTSTGAPGA